MERRRSRREHHILRGFRKYLLENGDERHKSPVLELAVLLDSADFDEVDLELDELFNETRLSDDEKSEFDVSFVYFFSKERKEKYETHDRNFFFGINHDLFLLKIF